jgi:alpha-tubulin suppressor-like RCC1 family protein
MLNNLECGKLFGIGSEVYNTTDDCSKINQIEFFSNIFIVDVVCGNTHCLSISKNGEIFGWGNNSNCQLGNEKSFTSQNPIKIFNI